MSCSSFGVPMRGVDGGKNRTRRDSRLCVVSMLFGSPLYFSPIFMESSNSQSSGLSQDHTMLDLTDSDLASLSKHLESNNAQTQMTFKNKLLSILTPQQVGSSLDPTLDHLFDETFAEEQPSLVPDESAYLTSLLARLPSITPQLPSSCQPSALERKTHAITDDELKHFTFDLLRQHDSGFDLPLSTSMHDNSMLRKAKSSDLACLQGKQCLGVVGGIPCPSTTQTGFTLVRFLTPDEDRRVRSGQLSQQNIEPGLCLLCLRSAMGQVLLHTNAMGPTVDFSKLRQLQSVRTRVDVVGGYKSSCTLQIDPGHRWVGLCYPVVAFLPKLMHWEEDPDRPSSWRVNQDKLIFESLSAVGDDNESDTKQNQSADKDCDLMDVDKQSCPRCSSSSSSFQ